MLQTVFTYLAMLPSVILFLLFISRSAKLRRPRLFTCVAAFLTFAMRLMGDLMFPEISLLVPILCTLTVVVLTILMAPPGGRIWAVAVSAMYVCSAFLSELALVALVYYVLEPLGVTTMDYLMSNTWGYVVMTAVNSLLAIAFFLFTHWIVTHVNQMKRLNVGMLALYILVLLSQVALISVVIVIVNGVAGVEVMPFLIPLSIMLTLGADIGFFFGMSKQQQAQTLKAQAQQAETALELQSSYYDKLQENILEINQIRHDLSNQLQTAYRLLSLGAEDEARQQLDLLNAKAQSRVGPAFCSNLVADAVFTEKAETSAKKDIKLHIMAELPPQLPVSTAHLCSALSNILDNAIAAVLNCDSERKLIELDAHVRSGYLVIRCKNSVGKRLPSAAADRDVLRRHGLGLDILRAIAKTYGGDLHTDDSESGFFTVTLLLSCADEPATVK